MAEDGIDDARQTVGTATYLDVHLGCRHGRDGYLNDQEQLVPYNETNYGVGVTHLYDVSNSLRTLDLRGLDTSDFDMRYGVTAGVYNNSYSEPTFYAGVQVESAVQLTNSFQMAAGMRIAGATNYEHTSGMPVTPMVQATLRASVDKFGIILGYTPPIERGDVSTTSLTTLSFQYEL